MTPEERLLRKSVDHLEAELEKCKGLNSELAIENDAKQFRINQLEAKLVKMEEQESFDSQIINTLTYKEGCLKAELVALRKENATLEMQLELDREAYNLDRQRLEAENTELKKINLEYLLALGNKREEIYELRLHTVPDWGEPGAVPALQRQTIFLLRRNKNEEAIPMTLDRYPYEKQKQFLCDMFGPEFQLAGPIPMPREKE